MNSKSELNSALQLHRAGQLDAATVIYRRVYENNRDDADACYGLGTVLLHQKQYPEAAELLGQAARLQPDVAEFVFNHAGVLERLGNQAEATKGFLRAAELFAGDAGMLPTICQKLIDIGRADAALHYLAKVRTESVDILGVTARAQSARGDFGGAAMTLQRATKVEPENAAIWRELAIANGRRRDFVAAVDAYQTYMELKSPDANDQLAYADLLFMARRTDEVRETVEKAIAGGANYSAGHLLAAKAARLDGDYVLSRKHLNEAIEKRPAFGDAWQLLLETETEESLPQFASECSRLAADSGASTRDRIILSLTAGRAFEKFGQYPRAFELFRDGEELQKADQASRGLVYDAAAIEQFSRRVQSECDVPFVGAPKKSAEDEPIFILGMPRSGTTVLERILGGLDGVVTGGESESLEFIASQYYWDLERGRAKPPRDLAATEWSALATEYWRRSLSAPCRLTDKMPHNFWHVGFICAIFPSAPVIYLRRDPRDVCLSIYSRMFSDGHLYATDLNSLAHFISISVQLMDHWKKLYPDRILEVQYEELVANPEQQTQAIAAHCGLEWRAGCLDFHERVEPSFTFSEMQVREPLNAKGVGAWRRYEDGLRPLLDALQQYGINPNPS